MIQRPVAPWRVAVRWIATLAVVLTPFVRVRGGSLLRIDTASRSLYLLGRPHPLEQMFLLLLGFLFLLCSLLLLTLVLGRVWCGWACPQTAFTDLTDAFARWLGVATTPGASARRPVRRAVLHLVYAALGALVALNLVWYFLSPYEFLRLLVAGALPGPAVLVLAVVGLTVYADLAFVRHGLCRSLCPYGRFQAALADAGTLTLQLLPERADRCLQCGACRRACPTGVDIRESRQGQQVECINCGRCRDACARVMARKDEPGLIGYRAAGGAFGLRAFLNLRVAVLGVAAFGALTALSVSASRWEPVSLAVRRPPARDRLLADGRTAAFFFVDVANRGERPRTLGLTVATSSGLPLELRGAGQGISLSPGSKVHLNLTVLLPPGVAVGPVALTFRARDPGGAPLASARATAGKIAP